MTKFFDDYFNVKKMVESKKEYKQQMARVKLLPQEYQFVFKKIQEYMWKFTAGAGYDMLQVHYDLIALFEDGVANKRKVLEITGEDVAAFCDELLANTSTYTQSWKAKLNNEIVNEIKGNKNA